MKKSKMRLELERLKVSHATYNTYVDVGSASTNGKRAVFRTKSEPIHSRLHMNYGRRVLGQSGFPHYKQEAILNSTLESHDDHTSKSLYVVVKSPTEYCQIKEVNRESTTMTNSKPAKAILKKSESHKSTLKRSSSISEVDLNKSQFVVAAEELQRKRSECDAARKLDAMCTVSSDSSQPITTDLSRTVITKQPQSDKQDENAPSCDIPTKDNCFRCLKNLQNFVNCCTCHWCFDACCYHCFKDDVGYTSWFREMLSCNKRPAENIRQWGLFSIATVVFPCILLYPILGGAVNQCLKCRLNKCHNQ